MAAKTAKTVKVVRSVKTVRVVKPAGRVVGSAKPVPSFPRSPKPVDPWQTPIAKDFPAAPRVQRAPQHQPPGGAALTIQRGGGGSTKVTRAAVREDRVAKKRGDEPKTAKPAKKDSGRPLKFSKQVGELPMTPKAIKALAQLVKLQLEGKPITKRKQYPTRNSTIVRVPNEILDLVKQQIAAYRRKKAESK
jgi:hypothetical protein